MDQDKIWDIYQNDPKYADAGCFGGKFGGRHRFIASKIPRQAKALNIGVGTGALEALLIRKDVIISSLDPSEVAVKKIRKRFGIGERAQVGYSQKLPFADSAFQYVVMSEVLEHLETPILHQTIEEVFRVLEPYGRFIGTIPADENLNENMFVFQHCGEQSHRWGHVQSFSRERFMEVLYEQFSLVTVRRTVLADSDLLNWKGKISWCLRSLQAKLGKKGSGQSFYFEAIKN